MTVATRSTEECSASEISARLPMATPTTNLVAAMPALAKIEIAATRVLTLAMGALIGAGLAGRAATSTRGFATANQSRKHLPQSAASWSELTEAVEALRHKSFLQLDKRFGVKSYACKAKRAVIAAQHCIRPVP